MRCSATRNCGSSTTTPSTRTQPPAMNSSASRREQPRSSATRLARRMGSVMVAGSGERTRVYRHVRGFDSRHKAPIRTRLLLPRSAGYAFGPRNPVAKRDRSNWRRPMKTALALSLLLFTSSALAAVIGKDVSYKAGDTVMKGFLAYDDAVKTKRAGVLVVLEWWGANDYARKRARMLAREGYVALVVDMYGNGQTTDNPKEAGELSGNVNKNPALRLTRFQSGEI